MNIILLHNLIQIAMIQKLLLIPFLCGSLSIVHAQTVGGIIFEDQNNNGKKERKEPGVANVAVSNGTQVVLTDQKGKYELPVDQDDIIFVIKPGGYALPVNDKNQPHFYYIHKPQGSPQLDFEGVKPTGKLPESLNFPLLPTEEPENFTALFFGDPQPYTREEVDYFAKGIVSEVEGIENIPFGLSLGDLVGDDLELFMPYVQAVQKIGIPWFNVMGNHDMNYDAEADTLADETFESVFGPANYAFNYGKVHFIVLDDILYPDPRDQKGYWGGFREDQLKFVENDLKHVPEDYLVVLAFHIPVFEENNDSFNDEDREKLFDLLKDFPHTLSLSAHTHTQRHHFFDTEEGWKGNSPHHHYNVGTTSGDWYSGEPDGQGVPQSMMRDGTPKGYAFITFRGNEYIIDYKVAGKPDDYRMAIHTPKVVPQNTRYNGEVTVNFFQGSERAQVEYRVDQGDWQEMRHVEAPDPAMVAIEYNWDYAEELPAGRRPSHPILSKHIWKAPIPNDLPVGEHTMEVKATDMFGRTFTHKSTYRIEEAKSNNY